MENEQMLEQKKLDEFLQVINENLKELREKKKEVDQENKELYDAYMEGDVELYSSLMVSSTMQDHVNHSITANESALEKTHFGRIDYLDQEKGWQSVEKAFSDSCGVIVRRLVSAKGICGKAYY